MTHYPDLFPKIGEPIKGKVYQAPTKELSAAVQKYLKSKAGAWLIVDKNSPPNKVWFRIEMRPQSYIYDTITEIARSKK